MINKKKLQGAGGISEAPPAGADAGSKLFVYNWSGADVLYRYTMSTPWDLSTATYDSVSLAADIGGPTAIYFKPDGLRFFATERFNEVVVQYSMFNPFDIASAVYSGEIYIGGDNTNPYGLAFDPTGEWMFIQSRAGTYAAHVTAYQLSNNWDVRSATLNTGRTLDFSGLGTGNADGISFADSGTKLYIKDDASATLIRYDLATAYDPSSQTSSSTGQSLSGTQDDHDIQMKDDGTRLYGCDTNSEIHQYTLSPAYTDTTLANSATLDVSGQVAAAHGLYINTTAFTPNDDASTPNYATDSIDVTSGGLEVSSVYGSDWGTGDFTIEAWVYPTSLSNSWNAIFGHTYAAGGGLVYVRSDGSLEFYEGGDRLSSAAGLVTANSWYHVALVNNSGILTFYLNGTSVAIAAYSRSITATDFYLGENQSGSEAWQGYITRAHATNHAKYTAAFTPSTTYVADGNSLILLVTDGTNFRDISQAATITDNGAAVNGSYPP